MAYLLDYLVRKSDVPFRQQGYNELDALAFSRLCYIPFDDVLGESFVESSSIREAGRLFLRRYAAAREYFDRLLMLNDDVRLVELMVDSVRYGPLMLCGYVNRVDFEQQKQFSALSILLNDAAERVCIAYRGTDNTVVGWKEDFNMSFLAQVPSQLEAVAYLETAAAYLGGPLLLSGHSKGGNLAIYSALCSPESLRRRIEFVHNFDGPGLDDSVLQANEDREILSRIHTYLPQSSVVGMLFAHEEPYTVVHSRQIGLLQHDPYTWRIEGERFVRLDQVSRSSLILDRTLKDWIASLEPEQRRSFIDLFYGVLMETDAKTLPELSDDWFHKAQLVLHSLRNVDEESQKMITEALRSLRKAARRNLLP